MLWVGNGAFITHGVIEADILVQFIISVVEKKSPKDRKRPINRDILSRTLEDWRDGPIANGVIDVGTVSLSSFVYINDQPKAYPRPTGAPGILTMGNTRLLLRMPMGGFVNRRCCACNHALAGGRSKPGT